MPLHTSPQSRTNKDGNEQPPQNENDSVALLFSQPTSSVEPRIIHHSDCEAPQTPYQSLRETSRRISLYKETCKVFDESTNKSSPNSSVRPPPSYTHKMRRKYYHKRQDRDIKADALGKDNIILHHERNCLKERKRKDLTRSDAESPATNAEDVTKENREGTLNFRKSTKPLCLDEINHPGNAFVSKRKFEEKCVLNAKVSLSGGLNSTLSKSGLNPASNNVMPDSPQCTAPTQAVHRYVIAESETPNAEGKSFDFLKGNKLRPNVMWYGEYDPASGTVKRKVLPVTPKESKSMYKNATSNVEKMQHDVCIEPKEDIERDALEKHILQDASLGILQYTEHSFPNLDLGNLDDNTIITQSSIFPIPQNSVDGSSKAQNGALTPALRSESVGKGNQFPEVNRGIQLFLEHHSEPYTRLSGSFASSSITSYQSLAEISASKCPDNPSKGPNIPLATHRNNNAPRQKTISWWDGNNGSNLNGSGGLGPLVNSRGNIQREKLHHGRLILEDDENILQKVCSQVYSSFTSFWIASCVPIPVSERPG